MIKQIAAALIRRAEIRLGVSLDYTHAIARADIGLLARYNRIFGFLDPNRKVPAEAYHAARLIGALSADCGTCVEAEINLAKQAGLPEDLIVAILKGDTLSEELEAVVGLARAVTAARADDPEARDTVLRFYGEKGLIELSFAMNGAALLPGIKRAMGYATACDLKLMKCLN